MRTILAVAVLALGFAGLAAQEKKGEKKEGKKLDKKFESKEGKFAAQFPVFPTQQAKSAGGLTQTLFIAEADKGKGGFMVVYADLPAEALKAPKPEQIVETGAKGLEEYFKAKLTKSEATTFGPKKLPARQIVAEKNEGNVMWNARGVIILSGSRLYQVYAFGPKDFITGKEADDFLASFEITG